MASLSIDQAMRRAKTCEREGDIEGAKALYSAILGKFPKNARARAALTSLESSATGEQEAPSDKLAAVVSLYRQGKLEAAAVESEALLEHFPSHFLWNLAGVCRKGIGDLDKAETAFRNAIRLKDDFKEAHFNLGNLFSARGDPNAAIPSYLRAVAIEPGDPSLHFNLGVALMNESRLDEAVASFGRAVKIKPDHAAALAQKLHQQAHMCDWTAFAEFEKAASGIGIAGDAIDPFTTLTYEDNPGRQAIRSRRFVEKLAKHQAPPIHAPNRSGRIRVGYFSADFHNHATLHLLVGLLREHDRSRFDVFAFSYGAGGADELRARGGAGVTVRDIYQMPDREAVELARSHSLDIAIDLKGYTQNARTNLFVDRLAPVQVSYLGYPGTMGADFIDYIVADPVVIPETERRHFSEKIIYLPGSYQPNDNRREIARTGTTRCDFGLPESGFVFCCFNQTYKIGRREFDIWMRVLGQVEGSVLWLLRSNPWAEANLRKEAEARGIDPDRLVFAERLPHAEHLARHAHADLFIDTFNVNAHTTASDALWTGLPVVTKAGRQFSARVAASLLTAVGMPELITETEADYEALILELATNPDRLAATKAKLAENRLTQPLFDTVRYTRDFEAALETAYKETMGEVR